MSENLLKKYGQPLVYKIINPFIGVLVRWKVQPNTITTIGLLINTAATVIFIWGAEYSQHNDHSYIGWAGAVILFGGLFDMIDGRLARVGKMASVLCMILYLIGTVK
ncbi:MAG: CDP-alcohol phosphatidyltransferase family protein [Saprospiraceae bacterium]